MSVLDSALRQLLEKRELSRGSQYQYRATISNFEKWLGRPTTAGDLIDQTINQWLQTLQERGLAPATRLGRRNGIIALWRVGHRSGLIQDAPKEIRAVRVPPKPVTTLDVSQVRLLLDATRSMGGYYREANLPRKELLGLWLRGAWDSAARQPDLRAFQSLELSEDGVIPFTQSKTQRLHVARLHPSTLEALKASRYQERSQLFPWPYSLELFRQEWAAVFRWCGIRGSFKAIRSASGTNVEARHPGAGRAHLGHTRGIAEDHYFDARIIALQRPRPEELG